MRAEGKIENWLSLEGSAYTVLPSRHGVRPTSGEPGIDWDEHPACSKHGAMLRVHPTLRMYRCFSDEWTCNAGAIHLLDQEAPVDR